MAGTFAIQIDIIAFSRFRDLRISSPEQGNWQKICKGQSVPGTNFAESEQPKSSASRSLLAL